MIVAMPEIKSPMLTRYAVSVSENLSAPLTTSGIVITPTNMAITC
jgi:hypothetical protein